MRIFGARGLAWLAAVVESPVLSRFTRAPVLEALWAVAVGDRADVTLRVSKIRTTPPRGCSF
jgi:hypothetical protein